MKRYGIGAAKGMAVGKAVLLHELPPIDRTLIIWEQIEEEKLRIQAACQRAKSELQELQHHVQAELKGIIEAQQLFLEDPEWLGEIEGCLEKQKNAEWAVEEATEGFARSLEAIDDPYLRERAADVRDLGKRVLAALMQLPSPGLHLTEPSIIIGKDITPSVTAGLDPSLVLGFATELGGPTSHSVIIARTLGFPAVVGVKDLLSSVRDGDDVVLDAASGEVIIRPTDEVRADYQRRVKENRQKLQDLKKNKDLPAITADGHQVELAANIGGLQEVAAALEWGAEGIGLFRTEFLYMQKNALPDEEQQAKSYIEVTQRLSPRPVIFRTLDIGGDKALPYLDMPEEENPFLGYRALRMCLERTDLFKTQLRAILRCQAYGKVRLMFPMVATLAEWRRAKQILLETVRELGIEQLPETGIMIEVPSAAILAKVFAKEVDFFSIGSNDLIQYTMAADRGNKSVSYLYQHLDPAVLQLISNVIEAAHAEGKWVGMCGEMAGDPEAIPILLGLGLDEFSMSPSQLGSARELIRSLSFAKMKEMAKLALTCRDYQEVRKLYLQTKMRREVVL